MKKSGIMSVQAAFRSLREALTQVGGTGDIEIILGRRDIDALKDAFEASKPPAGLVYMADREDNLVIDGIHVHPRRLPG